MGEGRYSTDALLFIFPHCLAWWPIQAASKERAAHFVDFFTYESLIEPIGV